MLDRNAPDDRDALRSGGVWEIDHGWHVYGADGGKIGDVDNVHPYYLVVGRGLIFHTEHYVPVSAITNVERDSVYLNVSSKEIGELGWDTVPDFRGAGIEPAPTDIDAGVTDDYTDLLNSSEQVTMPIVEETLDVEKRGIDRGSVRVQKDVATTSQSFDIPLHEEDLRVVRHRIEREDVTSEIPADAFIEMEIEIPIRGEEIEVHKRPVVREQVVISKVVRERTRQVTETLRREELHVEGGRGTTERAGSDGIADEMRDGSLERRRDGQAL